MCHYAPYICFTSSIHIFWNASLSCVVHIKLACFLFFIVSFYSTDWCFGCITCSVLLLWTSIMALWCPSGFLFIDTHNHFNDYIIHQHHCIGAIMNISIISATVIYDRQSHQPSGWPCPGRSARCLKILKRWQNLTTVFLLHRYVFQFSTASVSRR